MTNEKDDKGIVFPMPLSKRLSPNASSFAQRPVGSPSSKIIKQAAAPLLA